MMLLASLASQRQLLKRVGAGRPVAEPDAPLIEIHHHGGNGFILLGRRAAGIFMAADRKRVVVVILEEALHIRDRELLLRGQQFAHP